MPDTLVILLLLNAAFKPVTGATVLPMVVTKAECVEMSKNESQLAKLVETARTRTPEAAHAYVSCDQLDANQRAALVKALGQ